MAIFTGKRVETAGILVASLSSVFLLHGGHRIGALAGIGMYLFSRFVPKAFNWLSGFADVPNWPNYVSLCVAALFAGHAGGFPAVVVIMGLAATGDGRMFDALY
jgi:hypothetical protein